MQGLLFRQNESLTKFKGGKIEAKNIRRNMMLKLKNPRKNHQSSISIHTPRQQKFTLQQLQIQSRLSSSHAKRPVTIADVNNLITPQHTQNIQQQYLNQRILTLPEDSRLASQLPQNFDRRMQQYLSVLFKKLENDSDKVLKQISHTKKTKNPTNLAEQITKSKNVYNPNTSYIKRLKINTLKLRLKKQRTNCQTMLDKKVEYSINDAHGILEKLRKTQQFMNTSKNRVGNEKSLEKFNITQKTENTFVKVTSSLPKKYKY